MATYAWWKKMTFVATHIKRETHVSLQVQVSFCSLCLPYLSLSLSLYLHPSRVLFVSSFISIFILSPERCLKCVLMLFCFVPIKMYAESIPPHLNANLSGQIWSSAAERKIKWDLNKRVLRSSCIIKEMDNME
jgi:hypothetical protein